MAEEQDTQNVTITVAAEDISSSSEFGDGDAFALNKATELGRIIPPISSDFARSISAATDSIVLDAARAIREWHDANTRVIGRFAKSLELIKPSINHQYDVLGRQIQELAQSIQSLTPSVAALILGPHFVGFKLHPILQDIFDVERHGDRDAAQRLAESIPWRPAGLKAQAIVLKARAEDTTVDALLSEAVTKGIMQVVLTLDAKIPIGLPDDSRALSTPDGELMTTSPLEWDVWTVWEWLRQESVRAAELWLFEMPYIPTVMLKAPPDERSNLEFTAFAVVDQSALPASPSRGRPAGTGTFSNREEFLLATRIAVAEVQKRHNKVTQERVAEVMAFKALLGPEDPVRQLRRYRSQFGFVDWPELLKHI